MKVRIAESAGFCMGVRKAMDCVLDVSRGKEVTYTLGPLIHNPQALEMLESRHVYIAGEIDKSLRGKTVVIRAHGVPPEVLSKLGEVGAMVVDATCPNVMKSQRIIKKYHSRGYAIVIVGDRGHAEIDSLMGYCAGGVTVVETIEEARGLPALEKACVVAQTTLNSARYQEIAEEISRHAQVCYVARTVCASTERRQSDIRKLAEITDATVVVGGKNSANTKRLAEISRELGQPTFLIEDVSELDLKALSQYSEVGVTAGASTPNWVIQQVIDAIAHYTPTRQSSLIGFLKRLAFFAVEGNFVLCAGAAALTYAMCRFMAIPPYARFYLMAFFYLFPLHAVNKYLEIDRKHRTLNPLLRKYWRIYLIFAGISVPISLGIAWYSDPLTFAIVFVSYLLGGLYSVRVIPIHWNIRIKSLRDIPGSKDIMIATAWTFAVVILPSFTHSSFPGIITLAAAAYVFALVFSRATILAMGGIESDKLVGMETIPVLIGRKNTIQILYIANLLLMLCITVFILFSDSFRSLVLVFPIVYMILSIRPLSRKGFFFRLYHQLILDADFFLTGILVYLFMS
ncbi:MAG: 4-hydroxy-3-methylbut-2-enyl diphosphate reductase [Candidatus Latescibacter sp.]|nr:4-hydroxy-3-methylbut-2-enyl diphosphate reductase [Candidatus Latescibacter sp.]